MTRETSIDDVGNRIKEINKTQESGQLGKDELHPLSTPAEELQDASCIGSAVAEQAMNVPNPATAAAMQESRHGGLPSFASVSDLMSDLNAED
jgi:hypothetical protein